MSRRKQGRVAEFGRLHHMLKQRGGDAFVFGITSTLMSRTVTMSSRNTSTLASLVVTQLMLNGVAS